MPLYHLNIGFYTCLISVLPVSVAISARCYVYFLPYSPSWRQKSHLSLSVSPRFGQIIKQLDATSPPPVLVKHAMQDLSNCVLDIELKSYWTLSHLFPIPHTADQPMVDRGHLISQSGHQKLLDTLPRLANHCDRQ